MRRRFAFALIGALALLITPPEVAAADPLGFPDIESSAVDSYIDLKGKAAQPGRSSDIYQAGASPPRLVTKYVPACSGNIPSIAGSRDTLCPAAMSTCPEPDDILYWPFMGAAGSPDSTLQFAGQAVCRGVGEVPEGVVPVVSVEDFRRLGLPAGVVRVQPPSLRTLVNVPTNVFVEAGPRVIPTQVLGVAVRVRATPVRFVWRFGDGARLSTSDPGAPYPDLRTTHTYTRPGRAEVSLVTVYSGEYSVAGGAWLPIEGTAQVASETQTLTVIAARNELVAGP